MAAKISTGLRNYLMATGSARDALSGLVLKIYEGAVPATADASLGGATLLCMITVDGDNVTGLGWSSTPAGGVLLKDPAEVWEGDNIVGGTAEFFRLETLADGGGASSSAIRAQGSCGVVGAELNLSSLTLVQSAPQKIDNFAFTIPAE